MRHKSASESDRSKLPKLRYDIRDQVQDSDLDAESIQCVYDDINRMVILIGDIPFKKLLCTPLSELIPILRERVVEAHRCGLILDLARVTELGTVLKDKGGEL